MKVGQTVVIVAGKYEGNKGKIIAINDLTLTVSTTDNTGKKVEVTLYPAHVSADK